MLRTTLALLLTTASLAAAPLGAQTSIRAGQTVTGTLDDGDPRMDGGAHYDTYVVRGRPGDRVVVEMRSADFDTYLHYGSEAGGDWEEIAGNDDGSEGTDSRLVIMIGEPGELELRAAGFGEDAVGAYELRVLEMAEAAPGRVRVGQTVRGQLDATDAPGASGPEDHYIVPGGPGDIFTAHLESDDFDGYLTFGGWEDETLLELVSDDDSGDGTDPMLVGQFGSAREHRLVVRSFSGEGSGSYTLRLVSGGDPAYYQALDSVITTTMPWDTMAVDTAMAPWGADTLAGWAEDSVTVYTDTVRYPPNPAEPGDLPMLFDDLVVEGALEEPCVQDEEGRCYVEHSYSAAVGEQMVIHLSSDEFDPKLSIGLSGGEMYQALAENDDGGPGLNAQLRFTAPQDGLYIVRATSAWAGQRGRYVIQLRSSGR